MQILFEILFVFILSATFGYILEVVYRSSIQKRLINPGFLVGCCLPIYGIGGVALYLLCKIDLSFISIPALRVISLMIIATLVMTLIEYIAGIISIKVFKNRLWDYSKRWGNIQGIICPLFSLFWGICCILFYYLVFPWIGTAASFVSSNIICMFFVGIYYGVFFVDLGYSMQIMTKIRSYALKAKELVDFENFKKAVAEKYEKFANKKSSTFSFKLYTKISNFLEEHKISKTSNANTKANESNKTNAETNENSKK